MLYGLDQRSYWPSMMDVLILIFLENALRHPSSWWSSARRKQVLILIFLENALRPRFRKTSIIWSDSLNPYFFGKCSTAFNVIQRENVAGMSLNPYFFGKCSTAQQNKRKTKGGGGVLILIFLENALRLDMPNLDVDIIASLNPYFFGKCSTATSISSDWHHMMCLNPYFFGKCSTASNSLQTVFERRVLILIFLENALRLPANVQEEWAEMGLNPYFFGKCSTANVCNRVI